MRTICLLIALLCAPPILWAQSDVPPTQITIEESANSKLSRAKDLLARGRGVSSEIATREPTTEADEATGIGVRMLQGLLICLATLAFGVWAFKKWGPKNATAGLAMGRKLRAVERISLGGRATLTLVTVAGREVLVAVSGNGIAITSLVGSELSLEEAAAVLAREGQGASAEVRL